MSGIIDYSDYLDNDDVKKLMSNGCLLSDDKKYILLQETYINNGQQLTEINAPMSIILFVAMYLIEPSDELTKICTFDAKGSPAQAYNYAATQFKYKLSQMVDIIV